MAADIATLGIRVDSQGVAKAEKGLDALEKSGRRAERATDGLVSAFRAAIGPVATFAGAALSLQKVIDTQRQFDALNAGLITATGSAENAAVAFEALQDFASETPYSLEQAVEGFTKLVNLGLTPSEAALRSYGNTAAAMGKDLSQMIEAVADAATGEFERLKEFGIKAKQQGDQVSLTFRGVTTTIGNNAAEIERYLTNIGDNEFAGAMERRMDSLDGALSNLSDEWSKFYLNVSQAGVGELIEDSVRSAIAVLEELNAMLASGEMEAYLDAIAGQWDAWSDDVQRSVGFITTFLNESFKDWQDNGESVVDFLVKAFQLWPANVRAFIQIITVEIASLVDRAKIWGAAIADNLNPFNGTTSLDDIGRRIDAIGRARMDSIAAILQERDTAVSGYEEQIAAARKLREEYDKNRAARRDSGSDRLAGFRVAPTGGRRASEGIDKAAAAAEKRRKDEFQRVVESLRTEEEAIAASYAKRRAIIETNTGAGSADRSNLIGRLDADRAEQLKRLEEQRGAELESLRKSLLTEEESIQESYDRRLAIVRANLGEESTLRADMESRLSSERDTALKAIEEKRASERESLYNGLLTEEEALRQSYERKKTLILESEAVTEMERQDLLRRLQEQFATEQQQIETRRIQTQLGAYQTLFDGLSGLAKSYAGEQSKAYRVLFAVSKAFSVAQAAMSIATGLAKAQELGFPANLAEMARVAATGASILAQINSANFSGAYDEGGRIPAGKIGLVGEYGPEFVRGPANVTSRKDTAKMLEGGAGPAQSAPAPQVNVRNINVLDPSLVGDYLATDAGEQLIMNVVQRNQQALGY